MFRWGCSIPVGDNQFLCLLSAPWPGTSSPVPIERNLCYGSVSEKLSSKEPPTEEITVATIRQHLAAFLKCESGAIVNEYAIAALLVAVAIIAGLTFLGNAANNQNNATSTMLQNSVTPSAST